MDIKIDGFRGMMPGASDVDLTDNFGTEAINCRFLSGDLESYKTPTEVLQFTKSGIVKSIFPIDIDSRNGGPYWLNWVDAEISPLAKGVDVIRGAILEDTDERFYFTGAIDNRSISNPDPSTDYKPKVSNRVMATTGASNQYPYAWTTLGVPNPVNALTVTQDLGDTLTYVTAYDGTSLAGLTGSATTTSPVSSVTIDSSVGNPSPSIMLSSSSNVSGPMTEGAYFYGNMGIGNFGSCGLKIDFYIDPQPNPTDSTYLTFIFAANSGGAGRYIRINYQPAYTSSPFQIFFGNSNDWSTINYQTPQATIPAFAVSTFYRLVVELQQQAQTQTFSATYKIYDATETTLLATYTDMFTANGGYVGVNSNSEPNTATSGDTIVTHIDNIQIATLSANETVTATTYVQTYVNAFGDEGAPSPATGIVYISDSIATTISGFNTSPPTSDYNIVKTRLYRTVSGTASTQYQFVMEFAYPVSPDSYLDNNKDEDLGEVLPSSNYSLPPVDGINLTQLPNGIALMSSGNTLCPSTQYQFHSFPEAYRLATDYQIVAIKVIETTAVVLTPESCYLCVGSDPSQLTLSHVTSEHGCVSKRSVVRWGDSGVVYASKRGLVAISASGPQLLTAKFITKREWNTLYNPSTITGAVYEDIYYGSYLDANGVYQCFTFDLTNGFGNQTLNPTVLFTEHYSEGLNYAKIDNTLNLWDSGTTLNTYSWKSKVYALPTPLALTCVELRGVNVSGFVGSVTFNIYSNRNPTPYFSKTLSKEFEFLIPPLVSREIQFELIGTTRVNSLSVSEAMEELA